MTWVAVFTALASPSPRVILSLRWKYIAKGFWSQAKAPEPAKLLPTRTTKATMCVVLMIVDLYPSILQFFTETTPEPGGPTTGWPMI